MHKTLKNLRADNIIFDCGVECTSRLKYFLQMQIRQKKYFGNENNSYLNF